MATLTCYQLTSPAPLAIAMQRLSFIIEHYLENLSCFHFFALSFSLLQFQPQYSIAVCLTTFMTSGSGTEPGHTCLTDFVLTKCLKNIMTLLSCFNGHLRSLEITITINRQTQSKLYQICNIYTKKYLKLLNF